jgi:predicted SAM-dependent methyltransferase
MKKHETNKGYAKVDDVVFDYGIISDGGILSWRWYGECRLYKAKEILRKLRQEYILQEVERIRAKQLFKNNKKDYEDFKKYIISL